MGAETITITSWNVNGIRARAERLAALIERAGPDVLLLQAGWLTHPGPVDGHVRGAFRTSDDGHGSSIGDGQALTRAER